MANREKVVVLTPGPKIIQTPPSGWEPTSGPGKGGQPQKPPQSVRKLGASRATPSAPPTPEAAPDVRVQKAESNCMCPMCLAARRFGDPEAEAHKSESKAETPAAKSFKLSPIRVVQRGPDGITRQIPVHAAPDGIAAELSRTEQALEPSSRTKRPE
ncbi:MAG: hypothetical protein FJ279_01985 [Planctomycetes bacterium]|nr:hypothetical protein [Planctomycetota bacterium]